MSSESAGSDNDGSAGQTAPAASVTENTAPAKATSKATAEASRAEDNPAPAGSPEEMAASSLIDAVYIAVPNSLHAALSILSCNKGNTSFAKSPWLLMQKKPGK